MSNQPSQKQELIFLDTPLGDVSLILREIDGADVIPLNGPATLWLKRNGIRYIGLEDIYNTSAYRGDITLFLPQMKRLLANLDESCSTICSYKYPVSGNEHCFITWFTDILFIDRFCTNAKRKYKLFKFITSSPNLRFSLEELGTSDFFAPNTGFVSFPQEKSYSRVRSIISDLLGVQLVYIKPKRPKKFLWQLFFKWRKKLAAITRRLLINISTIGRSFTRQQIDVIHIVQNQFEVGFVVEHLSGRRFVETRTLLNKNAAKIVQKNDSELIVKRLIKKILHSRIKC